MRPGNLVILSQGTEVGIENSEGASYELRQDAFALLLEHQVLPPETGDFGYDGSDGWWVIIVGPGALHRNPDSIRLYVETKNIMEV